MAYYDLAPPTDQAGIDKLTTSQDDGGVLRALGTAVLSIVAIHYGSYALKNAGIKLLKRYGSEVAFTAARRTSIYEDVVQAGERLDRYTTRMKSQADTLGTPLGRKFQYNVQGRAAQSIKRLPFELVPAAAVTYFTEPPREDDDGSTLERMGKSMLQYAAFDILVPPLFRSLKGTRAAQIAEENLQRHAPGAMKYAQRKMEGAAIRTQGVYRAVNTIYERLGEDLPTVHSLGAIRSPRKIAQAAAKEYRQTTATLRREVRESANPQLLEMLDQMFGHAKNMKYMNMRAAYMEDMVENIVSASGGRLTREQAERVYNGILAGQKPGRNRYMPDFDTVPGDRWYKRFGHTPESKDIALEEIKKLKTEIPGLDGLNLDSVMDEAFRATETSSRGVWRMPSYTFSNGREAWTPISTDTRYGWMSQQEASAGFRFAKETFGFVDEGTMDAFGTRAMNVKEHMAWLKELERTGRINPSQVNQLRKWNEIDEWLKSVSEGGEGGLRYQNWQRMAVDPMIRVPGGRPYIPGVNNLDDVIDFATSRELAWKGISTFEKEVKIPLLNFNPLQLFNVSARHRAKEEFVRWIEPGEQHPGLGGVIRRPILQIDDRLYGWSGAREGDFVSGRLYDLPGRWNIYPTAADTTVGRITRNILGLGDDVSMRNAGAPEQQRWMYRRFPKIAKWLDLSEDPSGAIWGIGRRWAKGAPAWKAYKYFKDKDPRVAQYFRRMVDEEYLPKEMEDFLGMIASGTEVPPEMADRVLGQFAAALRPHMPEAVLDDVAQWLPPTYRSSTARFLTSRGGATRVAQVQDTEEIINILRSRSMELDDVLEILSADAAVQGARGGTTQSLFKAMLGNARKLGDEDRVKKDIISYLLARPATIVDATRTGAGPRTLMQIQELDDLLDAISSVGSYSQKLVAQANGSVASMKLILYRRAYQGGDAAGLQALARDRRIFQEAENLINDWGDFPFGKAWRTIPKDSRYSHVRLNKFAAPYTYMPKFGTAFEHDALGAMGGVAGNRGIKTGFSIAAYHMVNRLRPALKLLGFDFREGAYTSATEMMFKGWILKRILPAMAIIEAWRWIDWKMDEHTEHGATETAFRFGVVEPSIIASWISEHIGMRRMFEEFGRVTGEEDRMNFLKYATMTSDQLREFWNEGDVPVRRGRWWMLSQTPFEGSRTMFYVPNLYRRLQARGQYTWEGGRGPEEFYFQHSWMPNPSNIFAPLNRILDPYAYEKATYNLRPYPVTGDFFTGPYGPVTPMLNATIGQFIKPTRRMHPEMWQPGGTMATGAHPISGFALEGMQWDLPYSPGDMGAQTGARLAVGQAGSYNKRLMSASASGMTTAVTPYGIGADAARVLFARVGVSPEALEASTPPGVYTKPKLVSSTQESLYRLQEITGIYGFGFQSFRESLGLQGEWQPLSRLAKASDAYGFQQRFWGMEMGGMGDVVIPGGGELGNITFSEIFRRFVPRKPTGIDVNPVPNELYQRNPWLPGPYSGYFEDFSIGDPYARSYGAYRMPGEAFARAYGLHPDYERGMYPYGPIDRFRVLSKVAPWSQEYKSYNRSLSRMNLPPDQREAYQEIRAQVEDINQKYRFAPYRFSGQEFEEREYKVAGVTPEGYIRAAGLQTPIRLAGLEPGPELAQALSQRLTPDQTIRVMADVNRPQYTWENQERVLEGVVGNLNKDLIKAGYEEEIGGSALSYYARTGPVGRTIGRAWEWLTHRWTPITTKFIQRRTALEHYERTQVYGVEFAPWTSPIESFVKPTLQSVGAKDPLSSVLTGAAIGVAAGRGPMRLILGALGGAIMGGNKARVEAYEAVTGESWVPKDVRKRWEQEEYMDVLQYTAAARNYSLLRRRAVAAGEQDPEALWQQERSLREYQSRQMSNMMASVIERTVYGGVSKSRYLAENPIGAQALAVREQMGQTLYGADLTGDYLSLQRAIPPERRMFFEEFLNAPRSDRDRILSLLPRLERRVYEAAWGMEVEKKPSLEQYFSSNYLPEPEAAIWNPAMDWEKLRIRMIERAGEEPSRYGYYPQQVTEAEMYPVPVPVANMANHKKTATMLKEMFTSSGLEGVGVTIEPSNTPGLTLDMRITRDLRMFVQEMIDNKMGALD